MATTPDVTTALDGSGRRFAFRPAAITGNGSVLVTISERGELERIFWPNVDHGQHLGELRLGLERQDETLWLDDAPCSWEQTYLDGSSVLRTTAEIAGTTVEITDLVTPAEPVIARGIRSTAAERLIVRIAPSLDGDDRSGAGYVDPGSGALVFYLRDVALAVQLVAVDATTTLQESNGREPTHDIVVHRAPVEGALTGALANEALLLVAFGATPDEAIARLRRPAAVGFDVLAAERMAYDRETVALAAPASEEGAVGELYARSLLVLEQLTDRQTGATIAAPEFDPSFEQSGGYGFVWPRDLGYVVLSFLAAGRGDLAVPALRWLAREQAPEGLWLQRYWTDGSLAPSWGLHQLDETGMVLFAYEAAWRELGDAALDRELWPSARTAADFLCGFTDEETGLPLPSVDLWEQTDGQHSYSAAATYGGLRAAAAMASRHEPALVARYREVAERVRAAIEEHLWSEEHGRYLRSRWVGRSDEGGEKPPAMFDRPLRYPTRAVRSVDREDARVDSSLLGLSWPFRAVDPRRRGCGRRSRRSSVSSASPTAAFFATRTTTMRAAIRGSSPRSGSAWPSARRETRPGSAPRSTTRSRARPLSACSRSRSPETAIPPGSFRSAGATRCSCSPHAPSSHSSATAPRSRARERR